MVNRRSFLGFLGVGAVTAPQVAAQSVSALDLNGLSLLSTVPQAMEDMGPYGSGSRMEWATRKLAKMAAKSLFDIEQDKSEYNVYSLTPDVAGLRSVSLGHKMRMVRDAAFELEQAKLKTKCQRIIAGLDDD